MKNVWGSFLGGFKEIFYPKVGKLIATLATFIFVLISEFTDFLEIDFYPIGDFYLSDLLDEYYFLLENLLPSFVYPIYEAVPWLIMGLFLALYVYIILGIFDLIVSKYPNFFQKLVVVIILLLALAIFTEYSPFNNTGPTPVPF